FKAVVNGMNIIDLEIENLTDYIDATPDGTTNRFKAVVNQFKAVVNGQDLFNGLVDLGIGNQFKAVVNGSELGGENDDNDYSKVFAILDEEDAPTDTEDREIEKFYALNLITGLNVTSTEDHYIFPAAFIASIAANFNITYGSGRLSILPAILKVTTGDLEIHEDEIPDTSLINTSFMDFVFDENTETVFPDGIPYRFINSEGKEYEVGDEGVFEILINEPDNYTIQYVSIGKLTVIEDDDLEYCDDKHKKVYLCHKGKTICISLNAANSHLNNHAQDYLGKCDDDDDDDDDNYNDDDNDDDDDDDKTSNYKIYPNPVYDVLTIKPSEKEKVTVEIFNVYGIRYFHKTFKKKKSKKVRINIRSYPKDMYLVRITGKSRVETYNILKK
ncbi:MAG: T9SS type A sorting domain-containing protein, partial [Flavobacteriaceae bacterium]|nr:T9SS type A sorting domain-containing protein [Flavobacteriaceae bacterium]